MADLADDTLRAASLRQAGLAEFIAVTAVIAARVLGLEMFDVQLRGALALADGRIAEMQTGEGKTLAAVPAVAWYARSGHGVHVMTANDYLARRDAEWMGQVHQFLGLSVGVIQHEASFLYDPAYPGSDARFQGLRPCTRREAYLADITYGTNNEFGFDYLRDNMVTSIEDQVQRGARNVTSDAVAHSWARCLNEHGLDVSELTVLRRTLPDARRGKVGSQAGPRWRCTLRAIQYSWNQPRWPSSHSGGFSPGCNGTRRA